MLSFLKDTIIYPFDNNKLENKFHQLLNFIFKEYPAFLWKKPGWRRGIVFPVIILAKIFSKKKKSEKQKAK